MSKGFLLALMAIGLGGYLLYSSDNSIAGSPGKAAAAGKAIKVTESDFDSVVMNSSTPVLAYFWAPW